MAQNQEQPTIYDIEDYETGKLYQVEAYEADTTYDEAIEFFSQLPEQERSQYEVKTTPKPSAPPPAQPQRRGAVAVDTPKPAETVDPRTGEFKLGMDDFLDFSSERGKPLTDPEREQIVNYVNDPNTPIETINSFLRARGIGALDDDRIAEIEKARAEGVQYGSVVQENPFAGMYDEEAIKEEYAAEHNNWFAQIGRSMTEAWADPASLVNAADRTLADVFGYYDEELKERFPNATEDELALLEEEYIAQLSRLRSQAAQEGVAEDDMIPWLIGQFAAIEPYDVVPIGKAAKAATFGRRIKDTAQEAALVATAGDIAGQSIAQIQGAQDGYDPVRTAASAALSAGIGGVAEGIGNAIGRRNQRTPEPRIVAPTAKKYSRAYKEQIGQAVDQTVEVISELTSGWKDRPEIVVNRNMTKERDVPNDVIGIYRVDKEGNPTVIVNVERAIAKAQRDGVEVDDVIRAVTWHESLGHYGLAKKFGEDLDTVLDNFYEQGDLDFRQMVDDWMEANPEAYGGDRVRAVEEVLAEMAEDEGPIARSMFDRLKDFLKNFARQHMGKDITFTTREIRSILSTAQKEVTNKGRREVQVSDKTDRAMYVGESNLSAKHQDNIDSATLAHRSDESMRREWDPNTNSYRTTEESLRYLDEQYGPEGDNRLMFGAFRGPDGEWRSELSDQDAQLKFNLEDAESIQTQEGGYGLFLDKVLTHPELFEAYPQLRNVLVRFEDMGPKYLGSYDPQNNLIKINTKRRPTVGSKDSQALSTLLHEIQHWIQEFEGWARGGDPSVAINKMSDELILQNAPTFLASKQREINRLDGLLKMKDEVRALPEAKEYLDAKKAAQDIYRNKDNNRSTKEQRLDLYRKRNIARERFYRALGIKTSSRRLKGQRLQDLMDLESLLDEGGVVKHQKTLNAKRIEAAQLKDAIQNGKASFIRNAVFFDPEASMEAYRHLFGEIEARDTQLRQRLTDQERQAYPPYSLERRMDARNDPGPENYIIDKRSGDRYMRDRPSRKNDGDFERNLGEILEGVKEDYVPTSRSLEEAKRMARLAGLRSTQYKNPKGLEDLDVRLFQYDAVNKRYQQKLLRLAERRDNATNAAEYAKATDEYKKTFFEYKALTSKIQKDQAQIARALNAMKALELTKRQVDETLGLIEGIFKTKTDAEAFTALDDPETFDALVRMMSDHIKQGNDLAAAKVAEKVGKPYWWQYVLSYLHNSMLSGLGTHAVNAYDAVNILGRKLEERVVGGTIGTARKAVGAKETMSLAESVGFTFGIIRALLDAQTYKNTWKAFQEGYEFQPFDARIERQDARIPFISKVNDVLYASDMFWRSFHMSANLYSLGVRKAHDEGLRGTELLSAGYSYAINADKSLFDEAKRHADEALLVDKPSAFTGWIEAGKNIKPGMTPGEQLRSFTLNLFFPFLRVSDRLVFQALKRVPLVAFLDHNTRREWGMGGAARDAVLSRQLMGAALLSYYWMEADPEKADQEGYVEGYGPEDYRKRQALEATGYRPQSVVEEDGVMRNANQINVTANPFNTRNNLAVLVASIRQDWERSKKTEEDANNVAALLTSAMRASGTFVMEQGYADNISPYVAALEAGPQQESNAANAVAELGSRAVPAIVRQSNQMIFDPIKRDTTGDKSFDDRVLGRISSGIPVVSQMLPANKTALGEDQEQGRTLFRLGDGTKIKEGPVYEELRKLEREVPDALLTEFRGSFTYEGENIKLNSFEKNKWQAVQGGYIFDVMSEWVDSYDWEEMNTEEKIDVLKDVKSEAYQYAKDQLLDEILDARDL